jgi:hypothetical protein
MSASRCSTSNPVSPSTTSSEFPRAVIDTTRHREREALDQDVGDSVHEAVRGFDAGKAPPWQRCAIALHLALRAGIDPTSFTLFSSAKPGDLAS